ncbi:LysM domain-containing protein [Alteromonadaceae bacterium BrNp21-10]|nr:LysM domain-containing protein [Alteromonadaceae bacterium BrNp21-10]
MKARLANWLLILLLFPLYCVAITVKDSAPEEYIVKKGDTLWDISSLYLSEPWQWPELWRNNSYIVNPHLIYPGDELRLRLNAQGEAVLDLVRSPEVTKPAVKLTPEGKKITKPVQPIATLPWSVIQTFVDNDLMLSDDEYQQLPAILGDADGGIRFASGDLVVGQLMPAGNYAIIRKQNDIIDMQGDAIGLHVRNVADADVVAVEGSNTSLIKVNSSRFEILRGDRLMQVDDLTLDQALGLVPANQQRGAILSNLQQHHLMGKYDVVALDLGQSDVVPGTVMGIYIQGPTIVDSDDPRYEGEKGNWLGSKLSFSDEHQQPALKVGELVIFKVFTNSSYALITRSTKMIKRGAIVANP